MTSTTTTKKTTKRQLSHDERLFFIGLTCGIKTYSVAAREHRNADIDDLETHTQRVLKDTGQPALSKEEYDIMTSPNLQWISAECRKIGEKLARKEMENRKDERQD